MHTRIILILFLLFPLIALSQNRDRSNWIDFGGDSPSKWLQIAPGKLGPNALPVPDMDYACVGNENKIELGAHYHFMTGDTAINSFASFYWVIAPGRAAVRIYANPTETFHMTNEVRDERQINSDDAGWTTEAGDLLVTTYIQVLKEKKYIPGVSIAYTIKTTTGGNLNGRYTDAEMNNFYLAAGKSFHFDKGIIDEVRIAGLLGFYVWQTNKVAMTQDEGRLYEAGLQLRKKTYNLYAEVGGYYGWDPYEYLDRMSGLDQIQGNDDPLILRTRFEKTGKQFDFKLEYQTGFRDYHYQTFRLGITYRFKARIF
ncbi:MAG TPA: hypothetical protein PLB87_11500 [Prolixibacteraceae bacterium]|nr:hypothetical protein [Prolixibacteraceae bacterium]